jgi:DNA modification methylase
MILRSNSLQIPLRDKSVHCVITSPPYWGLRDYGVAGQLGLEKTPEEYVEKMVQVFREVWRVLRDDGTLWLNMGDSYNSAGRDGHGTRIGYKQGTNRASANGDDQNRPTSQGLKPKDLCGIPWRVAFALQADGWYLRSDIIWAKPNPMPESVTDRPTRAHDYIFMLAKSPKYFFDQEAVKVPASEDTHARYARGRSNHHKWADGGPGNQTIAKTFEHMRAPGVTPKSAPAGSGIKNNESFSEAVKDIVGSRNIRTVWTIATQPFPGAHFATFPEELARRCILAGTSEKGYCPECGKPWVRVVTKEKVPDHRDRGQSYITKLTGERGSSKSLESNGNMLAYLEKYEIESKTVGWRQSCLCGLVTTYPGVILDPFFGAGTVGIVAQKYNRRFVGLELKMDYCQMSKKRIYSQTPAMI